MRAEILCELSLFVISFHILLEEKVQDTLVMAGASRLIAHRAIVSQDHIRIPNLTKTPKQFHVYRHLGSVSQVTNTRNDGYRVVKTRAALEDPPRPPSKNVHHKIEAPYEVDSDLYDVLSLASDEELEYLYSSLYGKSTSTILEKVP